MTLFTKEKNKKEKKIKSKARKTVDIILSVLSTIVLLVIVVCIACVFVSRIKGEAPNLFGFRFLRILTDSMEPELPKGSSIIVKNCKAEEVDLGDYVTYLSQDEALQDSPIKIVTHKCVKEIYFDEELQANCILTQGIKEGAPVDDPVIAQNVQAKFVGLCPQWLNDLINFLLTSYGIAVLICFPIIACLVIQLISQVKLYRKPQKTAEEITKEEVEKHTKKIAQQALEDLEKQKSDLMEFINRNKNKQE